MSRSITIASTVVLVMSVYASHAEATRYVVEPVALSDGYAITGGFIETNTVGPLTASDITDFLFTVEGEIPHTFSPSNLGSSVGFHFEGNYRPLMAIDGQIILPPPTGPADPDNGHIDINFSSSSSSAHCVSLDRCGATLTYANGYDFGLSPHIRYSHSVIPDLDGNILTNNQPTVSIPSHTTIVVATVPEPSTAALGFIAFTSLAFLSRRKKPRN